MKRVLILIMVIPLILLSGCGKKESPAQAGLSFETRTLSGDPFSFREIGDAKLIVINYWEPWCGPCVEEMPALSRVYEEMKGDGLMILGVSSSPEAEPDPAIAYPLLCLTDDLRQYQTDYYPTTVLLDRSGALLTDKALIGAKTEDEWRTLFADALEGL